MTPEPLSKFALFQGLFIRDVKLTPHICFRITAGWAAVNVSEQINDFIVLQAMAEFKIQFINMT